jgi:hypothetical protein
MRITNRLIVVWTAIVQLLLSWDRKREAKARAVLLDDSEANSHDGETTDEIPSGSSSKKDINRP